MASTRGVNSDVQQAVFELVARHLAQDGIACISYNCAPGWTVRAGINTLLQSLDQPDSKLGDRITKARYAVQMMRERSEEVSAPYGLAVRAELQQLERVSDALYYHELLSTEASSASVTEFVDTAVEHGLHYAGDASFRRIRFGRLFDNVEFSAGARDCASSLSIVQREFLFDSLFPLSLRATLLKRNVPTFQHAYSGEGLKDLWLSSPLVLADDSVSLDGDEAVAFAGPGDRTVELPQASVKHALRILSKAWPRPIQMRELLHEIRKKTSVGKLQGEALSVFLGQMFELYAAQLLELRSHQIEVQVELPEKPAVSALTRLQASEQAWVTTVLNEYLPINEFEARLIHLLDGSRDQAQLIDELAGQVEQEGAELREDGKLVDSQERRQELVHEYVESSLERFRESGLLYGEEKRGWLERLLGR